MRAAGLAESNGSLPSGLWLTSPTGRLPRTRISSGTLRSVIEYGQPLPFKAITGITTSVIQIELCELEPQKHTLATCKLLFNGVGSPKREYKELAFYRTRCSPCHQHCQRKQKSLITQWTSSKLNIQRLLWEGMPQPSIQYPLLVGSLIKIGTRMSIKILSNKKRIFALINQHDSIDATVTKSVYAIKHLLN